MNRILARSLPLVAVVVSLTCARSMPPPIEPPADVVDEPVTAAAPPDEPELETRPALDSSPVEQARAPAQADAPAVPRLVRVGLATDLSTVDLPCCDQALAAVFGDREVTAVETLVVEPGIEQSEPTLFRLQVAALRDERQAGGFARRVEDTLGLEAGVVFDAGTGLYRVRVGAFETREEAEAERARLVQRNIHGAWVSSEQKPPESPELKLRQGRRQWLVRGRWLAFEAKGEQGVSVLGKRYRGRILVYLNDRGTLNVINEVDLDDYLRGVVPREMGPEVFDNLEALKAQAVAARSYTLRNMGEFKGEGYDICATPRCQVYGGMSAEHPLSDQAVLETSREVLLHGGEFVDALYSSTCGGHTENVETVFPLKEAAYLRGVPCNESGVGRINGNLERLTPLEVGLGRRLVRSRGATVSPSDFAVRLKTLAGLAGLATRTDSLASLERREVQRFIGSQFDLAVDARLLVSQEDVHYLLESPPEDWGPEDLRLAAFLVRSGLLSGALDQPLDEAELDETIFQLGRFLRVLDERRVRFLSIDHGILMVREDGAVRQHELPRDVATFSRRSDGFVAAQLKVVAGDRLRLFLKRGKILGIAHEVDLDGAAYDRTSSLSSWTRFRSDEELTTLVRERYPSLDFSDFEILERGVSGRVGRIRIRGKDGATVEVTGLPVRWTLDVPDTLFTARRLQPSEGTPGWLFTGRGWGHGVGMCQVGSYGMAVRGHGYRDILEHYYTGVEVRQAAQGSE